MALDLVSVLGPVRRPSDAMLTIFATAFLSVGVKGFTVGQTVKTTAGDLTGQASSWKPDVSEYLGIRYAEPPVGNLRFASPVAIKAAGKAVNATKYVSEHQSFSQPNSNS
jgi:Carboxylesterase family